MHSTQHVDTRIVKTPKPGFLDAGLLRRLLGLRRASELSVHPLSGVIFESFVVDHTLAQTGIAFYTLVFEIKAAMIVPC